MLRCHFVFFLIFIFWGSLAHTQIFLDNQRLDTARITGDLDRPWEIELLNEDTALVTSLGGDIYLIDLSSGSKSIAYTVPNIAQEVQSGLMGMAVHPDFPSVNKIYIAHTYYDASSQIIFRVQELNYNNSSHLLENPNAIIDNIASGQSNVGGRIAIGPDHKLYVTIGDQGNSNTAQSTGNLHGKILRYNLDGSIPGDNPIAGSAIYTTGHRNPQGICEATNGDMYISEHGPFMNDEVNILLAGRNYGWPLTTGTCNSANQHICDSLNMVEPLETWTPNIAPAGIAYYYHSPVPSFQNSILLSALAGKSLVQVKLNASGMAVEETNIYLTDVVGRIRDVEVSDSGRIYLTTSNTDFFGTPSPGDDILYELVPSFWNNIDEMDLSQIEIWQNAQSVYVKNPDKIKMTWQLYSIGGKPVNNGSIHQEEKSLLFDNLKPGIYVFSIKTRHSQRSLKLLLK